MIHASDLGLVVAGIAVFWLILYSAVREGTEAALRRTRGPFGSGGDPGRS